ncbi:hypothetical protein JTB14_003612 [Gonioctena quinquepunctata]|nr:hypothetical protein JTB14_003612 [Gonioctena quinquepunctata]
MDSDHSVSSESEPGPLSSTCDSPKADISSITVTVSSISVAEIRKSASIDLRRRIVYILETNLRFYTLRSYRKRVAHYGGYHNGLPEEFTMPEHNHQRCSQQTQTELHQFQRLYSVKFKICI